MTGNMYYKADIKIASLNNDAGKNIDDLTPLSSFNIGTTETNGIIDPDYPTEKGKLLTVKINDKEGYQTFIGHNIYERKWRDSSPEENFSGVSDWNSYMEKNAGWFNVDAFVAAHDYLDRMSVVDGKLSILKADEEGGGEWPRSVALCSLSGDVTKDGIFIANQEVSMEIRVDNIQDLLTNLWGGNSMFFGFFDITVSKFPSFKISPTAGIEIVKSAADGGVLSIDATPLTGMFNNVSSAELKVAYDGVNTFSFFIKTNPDTGGSTFVEIYSFTSEVTNNNDGDMLALLTVPMVTTAGSDRVYLSNFKSTGQTNICHCWSSWIKVGGMINARMKAEVGEYVQLFTFDYLDLIDAPNGFIIEWETFIDTETGYYPAIVVNDFTGLADINNYTSYWTGNTHQNITTMDPTPAIVTTFDEMGVMYYLSKPNHFPNSNITKFHYRAHVYINNNICYCNVIGFADTSDGKGIRIDSIWKAPVSSNKLWRIFIMEESSACNKIPKVPRMKAA